MDLRDINELESILHKLNLIHSSDSSVSEMLEVVKKLLLGIENLLDGDEKKEKILFLIEQLGDKYSIPFYTGTSNFINIVCNWWSVFNVLKHHLRELD
jgi:hypothetical protein